MGGRFRSESVAGFTGIRSKTYSFESNDVLTEHKTIPTDYAGNMSFSYKTYIAPESFIRELAASKKFLTKLRLLNNTFIECGGYHLTLQEVNEQNNESHKSLETTQEQVDYMNKLSAMNGFREFVKMMDSTAW